MKVLQEVSDLCNSSSKLASKERLLIESMMWLVEAKVKIVMLIQSATCPESDKVPALKDSPDTPLELAVASIRHIVGIIQCALDPALRHSKIYFKLILIVCFYPVVLYSLCLDCTVLLFIMPALELCTGRKYPAWPGPTKLWPGPAR